MLTYKRRDVSGSRGSAEVFGALVHFMPSHLHIPLSDIRKQIRSAALLHTSADVGRTRNDNVRTANLKHDNAVTLKSPSYCNLVLLF
jgi:hypothetical protein